MTRLAFAGEKSGIDEGPFAFEQEFGSGLWALVSSRNDAGKTSVFEILMWALRGVPRDGLQRDVRAWLRHVELDGLIDDEPFRIEFDLDSGMPVGRLQYVDGELAFASHEGFADSMSSFMLERLGLVSFTNWVKEQGSQTHGWPSYAAGLYLSRESLGVVLGDTVQAGLPGRLLLMFVGVPWAQTLAAAQTALRGLDEGTRKAVAAEDAIRQRAAAELQELVGRRDDARARLASGPNVGVVLAELDAAAAEWIRLVAECGRLHEALVGAERRGKEAGSAATAERRRLTDLTEAKIAQRLFHGMNPTQCPRCSTPIDDDRRHGETLGGHCSVCTRQLAEDDLEEGAVDEADIDDDQPGTETLAELVARLDEEASAAVNRAASVRADLADSERDRDAAERRVEELRVRAESMAAQRLLELELAGLEARVEQLTVLIDVGTGPTGGGVDVLAVLRAAEAEATERVDLGFQTILEDLNSAILDLGHQFGIDALQSIVINRATHMKVGKGGATTPFSDCTPGEKLRLKIAVVIALLRVAAAHGVGRHPGLLLIDSIGAEETESGDLAEFMRQLVSVTDALGIETIVASARPEILDHVPEERARVAPGDAYLW